MFKDKFFSITDLRKNTASICREISGKKETGIILNHNRPEFALIPYEEYQQLIAERLADLVDLKDLQEAIAQATGKPEPLAKFKKRFKNWKK